MESNRDHENALTAAERAALAPWIGQPPTPWWYIPSFGLLIGGVVLVLGERTSMPSAWFAISALVIVFLVGAWIGAVVRHQGVVPRLRSAPPEFVPVIRAYFAAYVVLLALVVAVYVTVGARLAAAVATMLTWLGLFLYERWYAAAADAVRERVS